MKTTLGKVLRGWIYVVDLMKFFLNAPVYIVNLVSKECGKAITEILSRRVIREDICTLVKKGFNFLEDSLSICVLKL